MWTTSRSRTIALVAALAATAVTGCGIDSGPPRLRTGGPTGQPTTSLVSPPPPGPGGSLPSIGSLPAPVEGGPAATLRTCEVDPKDPSVAVVEAVVVNTSSSPKMMQGLAVTVRDGSGAVVSSDGGDLWSSIRIGPGRRALLRDDVDPATRISEYGTPLDGPVSSCEVLAANYAVDPATSEVIVD